MNGKLNWLDLHFNYTPLQSDPWKKQSMESLWMPKAQRFLEWRAATLRPCEEGLCIDRRQNGWREERHTCGVYTRWSGWPDEHWQSRKILPFLYSCHGSSLPVNQSTCWHLPNTLPQHSAWGCDLTVATDLGKSGEEFLGCWSSGQHWSC